MKNKILKEYIENYKPKYIYQRYNGEIRKYEVINDNFDEQYRKLVDVIRNEISKDWEEKIKAKIEEYKKQIEKMEKDDNGIGFTLGKEWSDLKAKVEFGQSLLEKE